MSEERDGKDKDPKESGYLLVVDDTEMNRDMLSRRLIRRGYTVALAEDGQRALDMIEKESFDLILLDIMMPGIDGIEVLRRLRLKYNSSELPIIMVTAKDGSEDIVQALKHGANDYVTKPIDFPVVLARASTHLRLRHQAQELARKTAFIRSVFGRYLTDEVVESILETPEGLALGGQKRKVTILMSDLRGFSQISERLNPEQVVAFLNNYLGEMADVIAHYQGTIDEFIGDAILAIFGAPTQRDDDAERAVACALAMQRAMQKVNAWNFAHGLPALEMGIGVNTGDVVVGNIGSQRRAKYGVVGSAVNVAGRAESYTIGGQVLITEGTARELGDTLRVRRELKMEAKGIKEPITLFDVTGIRGRHDVFLDEQADVFVDLKEALSVECFRIDGKHGSGESFAGLFVRMSKRGAEMRSQQVLATSTNLKVRINGAGLDAEDLYVKVIEAAADGTGGRVVFTAVPPGVAGLLEKVCAA